MPDVGRRVVDRVSGELGTVAAWRDWGQRRRYLIAWDEPTPHQDRAWTRIPSQFFDWPAPSTGDET